MRVSVPSFKKKPLPIELAAAQVWRLGFDPIWHDAPFSGADVQWVSDRRKRAMAAIGAFACPAAWADRNRSLDIFQIDALRINRLAGVCDLALQADRNGPRAAEIRTSGQSLLLKMRDEGVVKFDIHSGRWFLG